MAVCVTADHALFMTWSPPLSPLVTDSRPELRLRAASCGHWQPMAQERKESSNPHSSVTVRNVTQ